MAAKWGHGSRAHRDGLGLAQGVVVGLAIVLAFYALLIAVAWLAT